MLYSSTLHVPWPPSSQELAELGLDENGYSLPVLPRTTTMADNGHAEPAQLEQNNSGPEHEPMDLELETDEVPPEVRAAMAEAEMGEMALELTELHAKLQRQDEQLQKQKQQVANAMHKLAKRPEQWDSTKFKEQHKGVCQTCHIAVLN